MATSNLRRPRLIGHMMASVDGTPHRLVLDHVERRADDVLWLGYRLDTTG